MNWGRVVLMGLKGTLRTIISRCLVGIVTRPRPTPNDSL